MADIVTRALPKRGRYLSLGCGTGDDVLQFLQAGWNAYGVDLSDNAVRNADDRLREQGRVICADVLDAKACRQLLPHQQFDLITTFDFWEHIWLGDIDPLAKRVQELLAPGGLHFNIICTRGKQEQDWTISPGDCFTQKNSWLLVSGHVTIRPWVWWLQRFRKLGFIPRLDIAYLFQLERHAIPALLDAKSWDLRHTVVVGKSLETQNAKTK